MKHLLASAALAAAALAPTLAHAGAGLDGENPIHPLVGIAITGGGDKLSSIEYTNGESQDITAGGLVQIYGGAEFHQKGSPFGFQATFGYHVDGIAARNGDQKFSRWPIEAIALFNVAPKFRLGVGARYATSPKFTSSGAGYVGNADFKPQLGGLVMGEWLITPSMGLQLRYVNEKYKVGGYCRADMSVCYDAVSIDGSHGGIGFNYYF
jgi:hypothetical protein